MSETTVGLLDTSVFVAHESGHAMSIERLPELGVVSVVTIAELHTGVLAARDTATRAARLATLESVAEIEQLPIDAAAAMAWAAMRVRLAEARRKINVNDLWIAATAVAHGLTVYSQDDDFAVLTDLGGPSLILV